ncbi:MAG: phosphoribosylglycinamide formyltransferase [Flavobacteriaceae bacterium]|nr:phosphoribosylglycinamide formyltransferase [Flavobacteriaceae bacterium]
MKRIAIFASGSGTNAENIIRYFQKNPVAIVVLVLSNKKDAKVLERAKKHNIKSLSFNKNQFIEENEVLNILKNEADFIVLAGFLLKVPEKIIKAFPQKIINIHPALLPKYGGKGMYGMHVHNAVIANKERETGISIHYVNENYDEGSIIFQKKVRITENDTPNSIADKVHQLEYRYFPQIIESVLLKNE